MAMNRHTTRREAGLLISTDIDSGVETESQTVQCVHCGRHWLYTRAVLEAIKGGLGFCARCDGITCGEKCQKCVPAEQQLENMEAGRDILHRPIKVCGFKWQEAP